MARTPQSHGLPSPPARSPCNIRTSIPRTFVPHLPKLGTAKHRLRYNVFGMLAYLFIWRQGSIYASAKRALALCLATIVEGNSALWAMSSVEVIIFFVLAWNIIEATYVIHVAPSPPQPTKTPIQSESSRVDKHPSSNLRYSSSPFQAERSLSSLHSFLNSSSTPPTPTPVRNGSPTFLRHGKQLGTANAARLGRSASFASKVPEFGSLLDTSAESPRISHVGRKSITTGRALDSRLLEKLLDPAD